MYFKSYCFVMNSQLTTTDSTETLSPIAYLIALFDNNQRNVIRAFAANGWCLHPQSLSRWKKDPSFIPPVWCARIEIISKGLVTRQMLRPDIFGEVHSDQSSDLLQKGNVLKI